MQAPACPFGIPLRQVRERAELLARGVDSVGEPRHVVYVVEGNGWVCQHRAAAVRRTLQAIVETGGVLEDIAHARGWQVINHANGDAAIDQLIRAARAATEKHGPADRRTVGIHSQTIRPDQLDAYAELGIIPSFFGMHTFYWGDWHREHTVGPRLADNISPTGWCVKRGMKFTSHHDAPVAFPDSMRVLDATVTRRSRSGGVAVSPTTMGCPSSS